MSLEALAALSAPVFFLILGGCLIKREADKDAQSFGFRYQTAVTALAAVWVGRAVQAAATGQLQAYGDAFAEHGQVACGMMLLLHSAVGFYRVASSASQYALLKLGQLARICTGK